MRRRRRREGAFTLVEIIIVLAIIALLAALALPPTLRARLFANEAMAVNSCRIIAASSQAYNAAAIPHSYPGNLSDLASPTSNPPYIDSVLVGATSTAASKQGYYYTYVLIDSEHFTLNADPVTPNVTGTRYFFADESGVVRVNPSAPAAPTDSPVE